MRPLGGWSWAPRRRPQRIRATYQRHQGVEYFLGFYDVHADCFAGQFAKRKRIVDLEAPFRRLRGCYPRRRLFVILDNLPHVHDHPRFLRLLRQLRITPVYTPTEASWLDLIEPQFGVTKRFTLTGTDDPSHHVRRVAWPSTSATATARRAPPSIRWHASSQLGTLSWSITS